MKFLIFFLICLSIITLGCRTTEYIYPEYIFPDEPGREIIEDPTTIKDYQLIIIYYEFLVREWEAWAESVKNIVDIPEKHE